MKDNEYFIIIDKEHGVSFEVPETYEYIEREGVVYEFVNGRNSISFKFGLNGRMDEYEDDMPTKIINDMNLIYRIRKEVRKDMFEFTISLLNLFDYVISFIYKTDEDNINPLFDVLDTLKRVGHDEIKEDNSNIRAFKLNDDFKNTINRIDNLIKDLDGENK